MKFYLRPTSGWAVVLAGLVALSLAGCGRKGALDLPPSASAAPNGPVALDSEAEAAARPSVFNSSYGADAAPTAPRSRKKPFVLDPLLD